jgi:hypothetical protein
MTAQSGSPFNLTEPTGLESSRPDYNGGRLSRHRPRNLQY